MADEFSTAVEHLTKTIEAIHDSDKTKFTFAETRALLEVTEYFTEYAKTRSGMNYENLNTADLSRLSNNVSACLNIGISNGCFKTLTEVAPVVAHLNTFQRCLNSDLAMKNKTPTPTSASAPKVMSVSEGKKPAEDEAGEMEQLD